MKDEDERLAEVWLAHFGTPMPLRGAPAVTRRILLDSGAREALRLSDVASAEAPGCKNTPADLDLGALLSGLDLLPRLKP